MNLLTGWDSLECSKCGIAMGRIYVADDYDLEVQCLNCMIKEIQKEELEK